MAIIKKSKTTTAGEDVERREPAYTKLAFKSVDWVYTFAFPSEGGSHPVCWETK